MTTVRIDAAAFATLPGDASARLEATVASIVPVLGLVASQLVIGLLALILISR